jgi:hypothetical protein
MGAELEDWLWRSFLDKSRKEPKIQPPILGARKRNPLPKYYIHGIYKYPKLLLTTVLCMCAILRYYIHVLN